MEEEQLAELEKAFKDSEQKEREIESEEERKKNNFEWVSNEDR